MNNKKLLVAIIAIIGCVFFTLALTGCDNSTPDTNCNDCGECEVCDPDTGCKDCGECAICDPDTSCDCDPCECDENCDCECECECETCEQGCGDCGDCEVCNPGCGDCGICDICDPDCNDCDVCADCIAIPYIIEGNAGAGFTAIRRDETVGTANQAIQNVIDAIKTVAASATYAIQFGNGEDELDIGADGIDFYSGTITLSGKISANGTSFVISLRDSASINSTADIRHSGSQGAIWNSSTGTVNILDGAVSAIASYAIANFSTDTLNISGGTVSATTGIAIQNFETGTVNISGGTVSTTGNNGVTIINSSTGKITVSGDAAVISANTNSSLGTIYLSGGTAGITVLEITGGTVSNTAGNADASTIYNNAAGTITISDGTVSAISGSAIRSNSTGKVIISGNAMVTSTNIASIGGTILLSGNTDGTVLEILGGIVKNTHDEYGSAVSNYATGTVNISGGAVSSIGGTAFSNQSTGPLNISGGTVSAESGIAVNNNSTGKITVSGTALVTSANTNASTGTIFLNGRGQTVLEITGGTVSNTSNAAAARNAIFNARDGAIIISGGTVSTASTTGNYAVNNTGNGTVTIGAGAVIVGNNNN